MQKAFQNRDIFQHRRYLSQSNKERKGGKKGKKNERRDKKWGAMGEEEVKRKKKIYERKEN